MKPYFEAEGVTLYLGDMREVLPTLSITADLVLADVPYGETSLPWDRWPDEWLATAAQVSRSMWCFGSMRMFLQHSHEFDAVGWKLSQDIVWEKHNGSGFQNDRFKRVHETATHWYRGAWRAQHRKVPTTPDAAPRVVRRKQSPPHMGKVGTGVYTSQDGGPRLMRSVIAARSMHGRAIHPTQKPSGIIQPLLEYACPPGGLVIDPFAGSGSTLVTARLCERRAIGVEADERYAERAAQWLAQAPLDLGEVTP